ncbi:MAG: hypothetical protein ACI8R9_002894 [Paraglaciecola sp.]|jgi:hypothetical protein
MGVYLKKKKGSLCSTASYGAVAYILKFPNDWFGGVADYQNQFFRVTATTGYGTNLPVARITTFTANKNEPRANYIKDRQKKARITIFRL